MFLAWLLISLSSSLSVAPACPRCSVTLSRCAHDAAVFSEFFFRSPISSRVLMSSCVLRACLLRGGGDEMRETRALERRARRSREVRVGAGRARALDGRGARQTHCVRFLNSD